VETLAIHVVVIGQIILCLAAWILAVFHLTAADSGINPHSGESMTISPRASLLLALGYTFPSVVLASMWIRSL
jgi:hypothetical protein